MATTVLNLQSFHTAGVRNSYSSSNRQPLGSISPNMTNNNGGNLFNWLKRARSNRKYSDLSQISQSGSTSKSGNSLHPQVNTTPTTRRLSNTMASNNPFNGMAALVDSLGALDISAPRSDNPPPYSQVPSSGGLNQSYYQTTPSALTAATPSSTSSAQVDDNDKYAFLRLFDTVFLIDDSGSMSGSRWRETKNAIEAIVDICTKYDEDGIDIHFINSPKVYENVTSSSAVREIFSSCQPRGMTFLAKRMHKILHPYVRRCEDAEDKEEEPPKPMNLIVITDGESNDPVDAVVVDMAKRLDKIGATAWQIGIQLFQVGNDAKATKYLQELDDDLPKFNPGLRDMVDTLPYRANTGSVINSDGILKAVLGAVNRRFDRQEGGGLHH